SPEALIRDGHFKRARAILEQRYQANPNDPETLRLLSKIRQAWGDSAMAVTLAEKALAANPAANPKDARYHLQLADALGDEAQKASVFRQLGLARHFKSEVDATLALDPNNTEALSMLMGYYYQAPGIIGGDKTQARAIPDRILKIDPVEGYRAVATLAQWEKKTVDYDDLALKALAASPNSYPAHVGIANRYLNSKPPRLAEAETYARQAIRIDASRVDAYSSLAAALALESKWPEVDTALADGEKAVPDNLSPFIRIANLCINKDTELARGERYARKYLTQEPEPGSPGHAFAHWRLGLILEKLGRKPEAIAEMQNAVKLDPNSPAKQDLKRLKGN
ncbi:MAG: tetratricopeptide repeat protein, partial [Bryobacteraceae bacterium]